LTAEVCVLNRIGVALAADSAVAIGVDAHKIFTSADKLFQLSRVAPVGVMIYGNAVIADIPWETVIKEYRSHLGTETFPALKGYANDFLRFLSRNTKLLSPDDRDSSAESLVRQLYLVLREEIRRRIDKAAAERVSVRASDLPRIIAQPVRARLTRIRGAQLIRGISSAERAAMRSRMRTRIQQLRDDIFGKLPMDKGTQTALVTLAFEMLSRLYLSPQRSGVVFAGFGNNEFMPHLMSFEIDGMIRRRLRTLPQHDSWIGPGGETAWVIPFAQQEMVHTFMQGIDHSMMQSMQQTTRTVANGVANHLLTAVSKTNARLARALKRSATRNSEKLLSDAFQTWHESCERLWRPVVNIVSTLPKDELAAMAESLVNLTKFRRRITPARETVGGPIDVALITRGDGFVWVKRKHYFDPNLNPRVMSRIRSEGAV